MSKAAEYIAALEEITSFLKELDANAEIDTLSLDSMKAVMQQHASVFAHAMTTGEKLRMIRKERKLTVSDVAKSCNLTEASVRYYETDNRTPLPDTRNALANLLEISPAALIDRQLDSVDDCIHALFDLEDTGVFELASFQSVMQEWKIKQEQYKQGMISPNDYRLWKTQLIIHEADDTAN